jgi:hypothetical protein
VPGFAVGLVDSGMGMALWAQSQAGGDVSDGKDEVGVVGNDVDDYEIDF